MARSNNPAYWSQRMKLMEDSLKDRSYSYVENMERQFMAAQAEVERQIAVWYARFSANNEITLADAKRLLTSGELAEFRWTVGEYIAYGQQNALGGAWMKQLENASARVHISRLEALKLQIQQQAEALYANQLDLVDAAVRETYLDSYYHTAFEVQRGLGVGWTMQAINEATITKVLSRPWTADNLTFRDRCWTNKEALVNSVNTQLTQMIIRGESPDRAISAISHQFNVSKAKAGRLVMTESAAFSSAAQKDCYKGLDVERYTWICSFDKDTCQLCGSMDGQVFKLSDYQVGLTAPPAHPWCRCCTAPYFEDMEGLGERWTRNPDGTTEKVPADMSFEEWRQQLVESETASQVKAVSPTPVKPTAPKGNGPVDVTAEYSKNATPGQGAVIQDAGYKPGKHQEEIKIANWLYDTYGGDIKLLNEADALGVKMPDFDWRGKLWELKTVTAEKSADDAVRRGLKQIQSNPGGIILDYGEHEIDIKTLQAIIDRRIARGGLRGFDVMIVSKGNALRILRYKK